MASYQDQTMNPMNQINSMNPMNPMNSMNQTNQINPINNNPIDPSNLYQHSVEIDASQIQYGDVKDRLTLKSSVYAAFALIFFLDSLAILSFFFRAKPTESLKIHRGLNLLIGILCIILLVLVYFKQSLRRDKLWMAIIYYSFAVLNGLYVYLTFRDSYFRNEVFLLYGYHQYLTVTLATASFHCIYFFAMAKFLSNRTDEMALKQEILMAAAAYTAFSIIFIVIIRNMSLLFYFIVAFFMLLFLIYDSQRILNDNSYNLNSEDHFFVALLTYTHLIVAGLVVSLILLLIALVLSSS